MKIFSVIVAAIALSVGFSGASSACGTPVAVVGARYGTNVGVVGSNYGVGVGCGSGVGVVGGNYGAYGTNVGVVGSGYGANVAVVAVAHPVFNTVQVVRVRQRFGIVPTVVTGNRIVRHVGVRNVIGVRGVRVIRRGH